MHRILILFTTAAALWLSATNTYADFLITVGDLNLPVGGTGTLDVLIESTTLGGTPLSLFNMQFEIVPAGGTLTRLEFTDPQPDSQLTAAGYVFSGNSFDFDNSVPVGAVSTTTLPNDTFFGGDSTSSGTNVNVTTPLLLARLQVTALTGAPPDAGDTFTIRMLTSGSEFNSFNDAGALVPQGFQSLDGTVTISSPVPLPSGLVLALTGVLSWAGFGHFLRQRRQLNAAD